VTAGTPGGSEAPPTDYIPASLQGLWLRWLVRTPDRRLTRIVRFAGLAILRGELAIGVSLKGEIHPSSVSDR